MAETHSIAEPSAVQSYVPAPLLTTSDDLDEPVNLEYTLEEMMPLGELQDKASDHLRKVLDWQFRDEGWYIALDMLLRHARVRETPTIAPDVAVFVGVKRPDPPTDPLTSWEIKPPGFPPPTVVFEIASGTTWRKDLDVKAPIYATMGVSEYYAFDPRPRAKRSKRERDNPAVQGWRCSATGRNIKMEPDQQGRLWSQALKSFVVADGTYLRLHDASGVRRLTGEESERAAKERALAAEEAERVAKERALAAEEAERAAKERALAAEEAERAAKERALAAEQTERAAKEAERAAKERALAAEQTERAAKERALAAEEAERAAKERVLAANELLLARLRELGIDPASLAQP